MNSAKAKSPQQSGSSDLSAVSTSHRRSCTSACAIAMSTTVAAPRLAVVRYQTLISPELSVFSRVTEVASNVVEARPTHIRGAAATEPFDVGHCRGFDILEPGPWSLPRSPVNVARGARNPRGDSLPSMLHSAIKLVDEVRRKDRHH